MVQRPPSDDLVSQISALNRKIDETGRRAQLNVASGIADSDQPGEPIGPAGLAGVSMDAARSDHVHTSALAAQQDVTVTTPSVGQVLTYNGTSWVNGSISAQLQVMTNTTGPSLLTETPTTIPWSDVSGASAWSPGSSVSTTVAGVWHIELTLSLPSAAQSMLLELADSTTYASIANFYAGSSFHSSAGKLVGTISADIPCTGSTLTIVPWITLNTGVYLIPALGLPRLSFTWSPS